MLDLRTIARALGGEVSGRQVLAPWARTLDQGSLATASGSTRRIPPTSFATRTPLVTTGERAGTTSARGSALAHSSFRSRRTGSAGKSETTKRIETIYDYHDENGALLFQVVRYDPKGFSQRMPDGKGGHVWSIAGVRRVPYRLPELLEAVASERLVFIAEGEKDVDALMKLGVPATCNAGGAGKWCDEFSACLKDADVVIIPDKDEQGEKHLAQVSRSLQGVAAKVRVLRLPTKDAHDWIAAGDTSDRSVEASRWSRQRHLPGRSARRGVRLLRRLSDVDVEAVEWFWDLRLARGKITILGGDPDIGKSQISNRHGCSH